MVRPADLLVVLGPYNFDRCYWCEVAPTATRSVCAIERSRARDTASDPERASFRRRRERQNNRQGSHPPQCDTTEGLVSAQCSISCSMSTLCVLPQGRPRRTIKSGVYHAVRGREILYHQNKALSFGLNRSDAKQRSRVSSNLCEHHIGFAEVRF